MSLAELFAMVGTDKAGHGYGPYYEQHVENVHTVVEIGVANGPSLLAWRDWFADAQIHGIDLGQPPEAIEGLDRIFFHHGNVLDPVVQNALPWNFDLVVDDGSHVWWEVLGALKPLWPRLNEGGWYVVEDFDAVGIDHVGPAIALAHPAQAHFYLGKILFLQKGA